MFSGRAWRRACRAVATPIRPIRRVRASSIREPGVPSTRRSCIISEVWAREPGVVRMGRFGERERFVVIMR